ncbi:hypothetical protein DL765_001440 [Monosporascus sp. GIB2]|nr:hypothetical protein DL765_001440 [Monosporascus sp. GIB2]
MRLINVETLELKLFTSQDVPPYAILSHTWRDEEVSLADFTSNAVQSMRGYYKIKECRSKAHSDGYDWAWVDTCCIDKTSSVGLSESINSMFKWYEQAQVCYAYLDDMSSFTTGPGAKLGTKANLLEEICAASGISTSHLTLAPHPDNDYCQIPGWRLASIAQKMSWASNRSTSRVKDEAYCLMGLFDVNMPLLYGEGTKAFRRLQEEIIKLSDDQSILTWTDQSIDQQGILAPSPRSFRSSRQIEKLVVKEKFLVDSAGIVQPRTLPLAVASNQLRIYAPLITTNQAGTAITQEEDGRFYLVRGNLELDANESGVLSSSLDTYLGCLVPHRLAKFAGFYKLPAHHVLAVLNCTEQSFYACGIILRLDSRSPGHYERVVDIGIVHCRQWLLSEDQLHTFEQWQPTLFIFAPTLPELHAFAVILLRSRARLWAKLEAPVNLNKESFIKYAYVLKDFCNLADLDNTNIIVPGAVDIENQCGGELSSLRMLGRASPEGGVFGLLTLVSPEIGYL